MPKILICNHSDVFNIGLKTVLKKHGFSVAEAKNAKEILKLIKSFNPDVVVVEKSMSSFTGREAEIVKLILEEKTNKEIAGALFMSYGTVKCHIQNILEKVQARSRVGIAKYVILEQKRIS